MIATAAIQYEGMIFSLPRPNRHHNIMHQMTYLGIPMIGREQGFLTSEGEFVERLEALEIAKAAGQNPKMANAPYLGLFSEDLW